MWSHKPHRRSFLTAVAALGAAAVLSACSFTPLYGEGSLAGDGKFAFRYADPATELDRIVYQELALSFGTSRALEAPLLSVTTSAGGRRVGRTSSGSPLTTNQMIVTATATITPVGALEPVLSITRQASAEYTTGAQRLSNIYAQNDARERAAKAAAQSLRLQIAAQLPGKL